jgi:Dolichyl-phosphate-mannose-protein mannosyltransferase
MRTGDYVVGLAVLAGTLGAVAALATVVVRRRLAHLAGAARAVAGGIVFLSGLLAAHLLPGMLGVLSRWTALAAAVLLAGAASLALRGADRATPAADEEPPPSGTVSWLLAAAGVGILAVLLLAAAFDAARHPSESVDSLTFHLPNVAAWIRGGSLWQVDQFVPVWSLGNYPQNGDVAFLATVMPWRNDAFAKLAQLPFVLLLALAVYALALELRAPRATAALAAALVPSVPLAGRLAVDTTMPDLFLAATFTAGVLFLVRSFRTRLVSETALAGLGLGLAFGSKWNGVSTAVIAVVVWAAAWLVARRPVGQLVRRGGLLVACVAGAGGFWLLRNWIESGNPIIPVRVRALGTTIFAAPPDEIRTCTGSRIVDYAGDGHVWSTYFWPGWRDALGPAALAALVGAAVALARVVRSPRAGRAAAPLLAAVALLVVAYAVTPYSALGPKGQPVVVGLQSRYLLPALALSAAVAAWAVWRLGRWRPLAEALLVLAVLDGARLAYDVAAGTAAKVVFVLAVVGAAAYALTRLDRPRRDMAAVGLAVCAIALAAVAGNSLQGDFNRDRYRHGDAALTWLRENAPAGHRIALAGQWDVNGIPPVLPAFGPRFRNHVGYPARSVQRVLRPYARATAWGAAVRRGRYDLVLVGNDVAKPGSCFIPGTRTDWNVWAREQGFRPVAHSARLTLYRVSS